MKRRITTFTALLLAATLTSCAPATEPDSRNQEPDHCIMHEDHASPEQVEIDEWNSVVAAEAKDTATKAATAYARPDLSETDWFKGLAPHLSERARNTFQQTSNLNIASTKVTKVHAPVQGQSPAIATVSVETNADSLEFLLSRADRRWVVETITSGNW